MIINYRRKLAIVNKEQHGKSAKGHIELFCGVCDLNNGRIFNRPDTGPICAKCLKEKDLSEDPDYKHTITFELQVTPRSLLVGLICSDCNKEIPPEHDSSRIKWHGKYICRSCKGSRIVQARLDKDQRRKATS